MEKNNPTRSCIITIDDITFPVYSGSLADIKTVRLRYPYTILIYTNYVIVGGKSTTWAQLEEMRDAGVDIESLTVRVTGLALPYGTYNEIVRQVALAAGYQALFTLDGRHMGIDAHADNLSCYAVESNKLESCKAAMDSRLGDDNAAAESIQLGAAPTVTQSMNGQHINDSTPTIKADLATLGEGDANSVEMRVSGVGLVPAHYEPKRKVVTNAFTGKLLPKTRSLGQSEGAKTRNPLELHC